MAAVSSFIAVYKDSGKVCTVTILGSNIAVIEYNNCLIRKKYGTILLSLKIEKITAIISLSLGLDLHTHITT